MLCSVPICDREVGIHGARGLCASHYRRTFTTAGLQPDIPIGDLPHAGGWRAATENHWLCECVEPIIGTWNACQVCGRKPRALLGVRGS